ncbi:MAG: helix-turn-helix domain-containing protein [Pseudobdellovibrionaceae bacterium]
MKQLPTNYMFGELMQKKRLESGLSQGDLAKKLGYSTSQFISNWERGICSAPYSVIEKLVKILNLNKEDLLEAMLMDTRRSFEMKLKIKKGKGA